MVLFKLSFVFLFIPVVDASSVDWFLDNFLGHRRKVEISAPRILPKDYAAEEAKDGYYYNPEEAINQGKQHERRLQAMQDQGDEDSAHIVDAVQRRHLEYDAEAKLEKARIYGNIHNYAYYFVDLLIGINSSLI